MLAQYLSYEFIALFMFITMLVMMFTGQRVFGAIGFVAAASALLIWGGEAKLRVEGKKMELTSLPDNEWGRVVEDSKKFWDDTSKISPRAKKVVDAFKAYASTMDKAGYPYR